jgi:hypothetical protein
VSRVGGEVDLLRDVKTLPGKVDVTHRALSNKGMNLVMPREVYKRTP